MFLNFVYKHLTKFILATTDIFSTYHNYIMIIRHKQRTVYIVTYNEMYINATLVWSAFFTTSLYFALWEEGE